MPDNTVTIVGNVTDDPELRFTANGTAVANFTVAVNSRYKDGDEWKDKLEGFFKINAWKEMAENVAESVMKGTRVVVTGKINQRSWENNDGQKRSAIEITADDVGLSLRWATGSVEKSNRRGS